MKKLIICAFALVMTGCYSVKEVTLYQDFDQEEARALLAPGENTISGSAFLRQKGGGIVTCAGNEVNLIPFTKYAKERIAALYGGMKMSYYKDMAVALYAPVVPTPDYPEYSTLQKKTRCDASGNFKFTNVADGEFFVQTQVSWKVGGHIQGGLMVERISVKGGEIKEVILP